MTLEWWQIALLISGQAFWTLFAVSLGANTANRSAGRQPTPKPGPGLEGGAEQGPRG